MKVLLGFQPQEEFEHNLTDIIGGPDLILIFQAFSCPVINNLVNCSNDLENESLRETTSAAWGLGLQKVGQGEATLWVGALLG